MNIDDAFTNNVEIRLPSVACRNETLIQPITYEAMLENMRKELDPSTNEELDPITLDSAKVVKRYKHLREQVDRLRKEVVQRTERVDKLREVEKNLLDAFQKYLLCIMGKEMLPNTVTDNFETPKEDFIQEMNGLQQKIMEQTSSTLSAYNVKTNELTQQLDKNTQNLSTLSELVLTSINSSLNEEERTRIASGKKCTICIENDIDRVLECGHVLCQTCLKSITNKKCFMCRKTFEKPIKLYLSSSEEAPQETVEPDNGFSRQNVFHNVFSNI